MTVEDADDRERAAPVNTAEAGRGSEEKRRERQRERRRK